MKKKRLDVCKIFQVQTNFHTRCIVRTLCGTWIWYTQIPGKWQLTLMYISPTATLCHTRLLTADLADNVAGQLQNAINCRKWPAQYRLRVARMRSRRGMRGLTQMLPDMILELRCPTMQPIDADVQHILFVARCLQLHLPGAKLSCCWATRAGCGCCWWGWGRLQFAKSN